MHLPVRHAVGGRIAGHGDLLSLSGRASVGTCRWRGRGGPRGAFVGEDAVDQVAVYARVELDEALGDLAAGQRAGAAQQVQRAAQDTLAEGLHVG